MKEETNLKKHLNSCEEYQGPRRSAIVDKQETLEEAAEKYVEDFDLSFYNKIEEIPIKEFGKEDFIAGAKWQQKRSYSEEDMISFATFYYTHQGKATEYWGKDLFKEWFEQFKKK
jgi:hypothetical protein